ncbi:MAG TPA: M23 family metallopeptidase [Planctomycetota bacterium]|nr:M23 family metallopeptidase [Planctomycetota bacterium]
MFWVQAVLVASCLQSASGKATYRLPYEDGKSFPVTQGNDGSVSHRGAGRFAFDFGMPEGTPVCAARGGKVVAAAEDETARGASGKYGGLGNHVKIDHGDGTVGVYMHLKPQGVEVEVGETVLQGDIIGFSGATGNVTGPHLHFQVERDGRSIPIAFDDVETDGGVPQEGRSYTSRNTPGIPAEVKDRLTALRRAARLAEEEGAWGIVYRACKRLAEEKLRVPYPPQEEARRTMQAVAERAAEAARSRDLDGLFRARAAFEGAPDGPIRDALAALEKEPGYREARARARTWERFYRALRDEVEGKLPSARLQYRRVLTEGPDPDLASRVRRRLDAVEALLRERLRETRS